MNEHRLQKLTEEKINHKFGSHEVLYSKYIPKIPVSVEREYVRMVNAYIGILKEELEKELPHLKEVYKENQNEKLHEKKRNDGFIDLMRAINQIFHKIKYEISARNFGFGLRKKLENLANMNRKLTVKEWKRAIKATLGLDIQEEYYLGNFYVDQLQKWVDENVSLIKTIPQDTLDKMQDIIYKGFVEGKITTQIVSEIQRTYKIGKKRAELIARDQTAKLNGQIQRYQQEDAGIKEYIWCTVGDNRVRKRHRELKGKKISWDNPPDVGNGRKCHPTEDYQCRCIARPVFNKKTLNLPLENKSVLVTIKRNEG